MNPTDPEFEPGDVLSLEHPDGSRLVNREVNSVYAVPGAGARQEYVNDLLKKDWTITKRERPVTLPNEPGTILRIESSDGGHHALAWLGYDGKWDVMSPRGESEKEVADPITFLRAQGFRADRYTLLKAESETAA